MRIRYHFPESFRKEWAYAMPTDIGTLTAMTKRTSPQPPEPMPEELVHPVAQRLPYLLQLCHHSLVRRPTPDYKQPPGLVPHWWMNPGNVSVSGFFSPRLRRPRTGRTPATASRCAKNGTGWNRSSAVPACARLFRREVQKSASGRSPRRTPPPGSVPNGINRGIMPSTPAAQNKKPADRVIVNLL